MQTHRIFIEKTSIHQSEANNYLHEIQHTLQVSGVRLVRHAVIYELFGIDYEHLSLVAPRVFYEAPRTNIFHTLEDLYAGGCALGNNLLETEPKHEAQEQASRCIAMEYVSGQYDQRADSAQQCLGLLGFEDVVVSTGQILLLYGDINESEYQSIKHYCINPIEMCTKDLNQKPVLPEHHEVTYQDTSVMDFTDFDKEKLKEFIESVRLSMSIDDILCVQAYFRSEARNPTMTEIKILDTYWSDHCRHTTFLTQFEDVKVSGDGAEKRGFELYAHIRHIIRQELGKEKPMSLMDIATIGAKYLQLQGYAKDIDISEEVNACSMHTKVRFHDGEEEDWLLMFKNETHNHPTEIEPYGGAATCLGGAIRDPLSGRSYVFGAMRMSGSADPREPIQDTLANKLPQRYISQHATYGFSGYGNQVGLASAQVKEIYHQGYKAKRLEAGFVMGATPLSSVKRSVPVPGDVILLVGGKTGRDGIGGAVGSSKTHTHESLKESFAEVQKGNPIEAHALQRLFRNPKASKLIKRCNDFGAGGISVAVGELADGVEIDLDKVPLKYRGLDGTEIAISESQERMAVVLAEEDKDLFIHYAYQENVEATHIAHVTSAKRVVMRWKGHVIVDIARSFLNTNGASRSITVELHETDIENTDGSTDDSTDDKKTIAHQEISKEAILKKMEDLHLASQHGLQNQFDSSIGAGTVLMPYGGYRQESPSEGAAFLMPTTFVSGACRTVALSSMACPIHLLEQNQYRGAGYAVVESLAKIVAMGGDIQKAKLTFQEFFQRLEKDPIVWGKPTATLLGALEAQVKLKVPAIGGKDSMSGNFEHLHVPPTFISFAVSTADITQIKSTEIKAENQYIYMLPLRPCNDGTPDFEKISCAWDWFTRNFHQVQSAVSVSEGGVFTALTKKALGNNFGMNIELSKDLLATDFLQEIDTQHTYRGSLIFTSTDKIAPGGDAVDLLYLGKSIGEPTMHIHVKDINEHLVITLDEIRAHNKYVLSDIFPTVEDTRMMKNVGENVGGIDKEVASIQESRKENINIIYAPQEPYLSPIDTGLLAQAPQVCIPVFPGTNCEYDTISIFKYLGAECHAPLFLNHSQQDIMDSIDNLAQEINRSQILVIAGGFSLGDQPGGSGKYIASVLRHPKIADAIYKLLERNGLMLGICNGFQALIKSGWLPYGKPIVQEEQSPTLTDNLTGLHISRVAKVKVVNNNSPWLRCWNVGDELLLPLSHGEGRFFTHDVDNITSHVATSYVSDDENPNGSLGNIEGLISKDGKIFGRMGHAERIGYGTLKNIPYYQEGMGASQDNVSLYRSLAMFKSGLEFVCT